MLSDSFSVTLNSIGFPCFPNTKTALRILGTPTVTTFLWTRPLSALQMPETRNAHQV